MTTLAMKPRDGAVERALLKGGFDRNAFLLAATLVKAKHKAEDRGSRPRAVLKENATSAG